MTPHTHRIPLQKQNLRPITALAANYASALLQERSSRDEEDQCKNTNEK